MNCSIAQFLQKMSKIPLFCWGDLVYLVSHLVPKDKSLWVFGAWFGKKYADNSKYVFEYVNKNQPGIRAVWLAKTKDVVERIRRQGYRAYLAYSIKGYLLSMRAGVAIVSHSKAADLNGYAISSYTKVIQLWHGIPMKKIGFDDLIYTYRNSRNFFGRLINILQRLVFPFSTEHYALAIVTSVETKSILAKALRMNPERIRVTGYPRNDAFFRKRALRSENLNQKTINGIYMPTFREDVGSAPDFFIRYGFDAKAIEAFLKERNICLSFKLHPANKPPSEIADQLEHVKLLDIDDVYGMLQDFDFLATDYSSVYFDYLLTDKPIIFAPFDMEDYIKNDREFYYTYEDVTPGPKARNWDEVLHYIEEAVKYPEKYSEERKKTRKLFHKYTDGNNSRRVFETIRKEIS